MNRRLLVNWKSDDSRAIVPVAELMIVSAAGGERYEFGYVEGVRAALDVGFQPFVAFPDLERRYVSHELFAFFRNRVLPTTRPDYADYARDLGLDPAKASFADLLGRSNGRRYTDRVELVLMPERDEQGRYSTHFLVRGVQHAKNADDAISRLAPGDRLSCSLHPQNEYNARARRLLSGDVPIGFVPDYLLADLDALEKVGAHPVVTVERMNPPPQPSHHRVLCHLQSEWPDGFMPFADPRFAPYRGDGARAELRSRRTSDSPT